MLLLNAESVVVPFIYFFWTVLLTNSPKEDLFIGMFVFLKENHEIKHLCKWLIIVIDDKGVVVLS